MKCNGKSDTPPAPASEDAPASGGHPICNEVGDYCKDNGHCQKKLGADGLPLKCGPGKKPDPKPPAPTPPKRDDNCNQVGDYCKKDNKPGVPNMCQKPDACGNAVPCKGELPKCDPSKHPVKPPPTVPDAANKMCEEKTGGYCRSDNGFCSKPDKDKQPVQCLHPLPTPVNPSGPSGPTTTPPKGYNFLSMMGCVGTDQEGAEHASLTECISQKCSGRVDAACDEHGRINTAPKPTQFDDLKVCLYQGGVPREAMDDVQK